MGNAEAVAAVYISNIFEEIVWCTASVYVAEVFPTTIRGTAQGADREQSLVYASKGAKGEWT